MSNLAFGSLLPTVFVASGGRRGRTENIFLHSLHGDSTWSALTKQDERDQLRVKIPTDPPSIDLSELMMTAGTSPASDVRRVGSHADGVRADR